MNCPSALCGLLLVSLVCGLSSCAKIVYDGPTYPATKKVEVYYDVKEISTEYEIMGLIKGSGTGLFSGSNLESKLIKQARKKGADAILFEVSGETMTKREQSLTPDERSMGKLSPPSETTKWVKAFLLKFK